MEYSKEELKELERDLEDNFKITKNINGIDCNFYDEEKFLKQNGALNPRGSIILDNYKVDGEKITYDKPVRYVELRDKLQQLYKLQGRREYARKINTQENKKDVEEFTEVLQSKLSLDSDINPFKV